MRSYLSLLFIGCMVFLGACTQQTTSSAPTGTSPTDISPPQAGAMMMVEGEGVCLPHKEQGDFQTMECAYGLRTEGGVHYALRFNEEMMMNFQTGQQYTIEGTLQEDPTSIYDIVGVIEVSSLQ